VIRSFFIALILEGLLLAWLVFQPMPPTAQIRGNPAVVADVELVSVPDAEAAPAVVPASVADSPVPVPPKPAATPAAPIPHPAKSTTGTERPVSSNQLAALRGMLNSVKATVGAPFSTVVSSNAAGTGTAKTDAGSRVGPSQPVSGDSLENGVVLISGSQPVYPKHAAAYNIEKVVKVKILVNADGTVQSVTPFETDDQWGFQKSIKTAVMNWRYRPGMVKDNPSSFYVVKSFTFDLK